MKRNGFAIRDWMRRKRIRIVTIQRDLEYKDNKTVWATIEGKEHNRRVLTWLAGRGCPKKHLALPDDMRRAA